MRDFFIRFTHEYTSLTLKDKKTRRYADFCVLMNQKTKIMKQKLPLILVLLLLGLYVNAQTPTFIYGDFEEDSITLAEEWSFFVMPANATSILSLNTDTDFVYSGAQSMGSQKNGYLSQHEIEVKPGTDYVITARTKGSAPNTKFKIVTYRWDDDVRGAELASYWTGSVPDTAWALEQAGFSTPADCDSISVQFGNPNGASICYFDDIKIMEGVPDHKAPFAPDTLYADFVNEDSVRLSWPVAVDSIGDDVQNAYMYRVFRDGEEIGTTMETTYLDENVDAFTTYLYQVSSVDMMENEGDTTNFISVLTVGKEDHITKEEIHMYPNPLNDVLYVSGAQEVASIQVFAITGKLVYETVNISETTKISLGHLQQGIYIVKCNKANGITGTVRKLVKE